MYRQGPCVIFDKETQEEKEIAQADLTTRNGPYQAVLLQEQARLADENSRRLIEVSSQAEGAAI